MKQQTQTAGVQQRDEAQARRVGRRAPKTAADVLAMQQLIGNRAVQAKLRVGPVDDPYEREADAMAEAVMAAAPVAAVQREGGPEEEDEVQMKPLAVRREAVPEEDELQRQALPEEEELQAKHIQREGDGSFEAGAQVEQRLAHSKGGGSALPSAARAEMEGHFGTDFSGVRVHMDGEAAQLNHDLSARAFTHGSDVYFGEGEFAPSGSEGRRLLAHELTHVVQQGTDLYSKKKIKRKSVSRKTTKVIEVDLGRQVLIASDGAAQIHSFDCVSGDSDHLTPVGTFKILHKHPKYTSKKYKVPMDYAMFFTTTGEAIHQGQVVGPLSFLKSVGLDFIGSHGCVRLSEDDAKTLFAWSPVGTPVWIH